MSDFIENLHEALLVAYIGDVGLELTNADCNNLSKYLQEVSTLRTHMEELERERIQKIPAQPEGDAAYWRGHYEQLMVVHNNRIEAIQTLADLVIEKDIELARLREQVRILETPKVDCAWEEEEDSCWNTDCGTTFYLTMHGTLADHHMVYCPNCGRRIQPEPPKEEE